MFQKLLSDVEMVMIPALQPDIGDHVTHGVEAVKELRQQILDSMQNLKIHLVDIVPEDGDGSIISIRTVVKATQVKPVFPQFPVGVPVQTGLMFTVALNHVWRPKAVNWDFIPVEPLLEICNMQDMVLMHSRTRTPSPTSAPWPSSSSNGFESKAAEMQMPDEQSAALKVKKDSEHACGVCVPCSFYAFRSDGCRRGNDCEYCHLCTPAEARQRRKQRRKIGEQPEVAIEREAA